ncbi:PIG-L deacetylase family protein [Rhodobacter ferrooxidans]|uniref:LmbE family protein n=1 Tax=Rhodobacter ferrooxidans TaxID=371731 RepID=C8S499_9RHOB|nr:PIG-L deacetylase family protein [Rhodobacter sp. SW2]EEW24158.1 LmbE family protein [Rhodobacter sp. SW2]
MKAREIRQQSGVLTGAVASLRGRFRDVIVRYLRPQWIRHPLAITPGIYENFAPVERLTELPAGRRLVVIAPHPDDESIGAGGLIALWHAAGRQAEVVFLTDGAAGNPVLRDHSLSAEERNRIARSTARQRQSEAETALGLLGAKGRWLDGTDGALWRDARRISQGLAAQWQLCPPDLLVVPFPADRHPDHAAAARIAATAADIAALDPGLPVLCYEVWSPCPATVVLDISTVAAVKARAIAAHESQVVSTDYLAASRGLAAYRAITAGLASGAQAEAFHACTLADLGKLCARLRV